jgi:hypothetical protein
MNRIWGVGLGVLVAACGASSSLDVTSDGGANADGGAGTDAGADGAGDGGTASGLYSLATCTTSIAADAPAFYRTYFKCVTIATTADGVAITTNGLPPHRSYYYGKGNPNYVDFDTSRSGYHPNPNTIAAKSATITIPNAPVSRGLTVTSAMVDHVANTSQTEYRGGPVGVAIDSVPLFNDQAAPGDDIDAERFTFDGYDAHPTPNGQYHYHTTSPGPLEVLSALGFVTSTTPGEAAIELYGVMCDGTVVLGCTELDGSAPDASALDAQNGHVADVKDKAGVVHFAGRYHTHVCPKLFAAHKYTPECSVK